MKFCRRILISILVLILIASSIVAAEGKTGPVFNTVLVDYDITQNEFMGQGTTVIENGSTLAPGQVFQVDFTMPTTGGMEIRGLQILHKYDPDIIEPVYYENKVDDENNYLFEPLAIEDNNFFPSTGGRSPKYWEQRVQLFSKTWEWALTFNYNDTNLILDHNNSEKRIGSIFYRVKDDAKPGSEIRITYDSESNFSGDNKTLFVKDFVGTEAYATVASELETEDNNLKDIKILGSTTNDTYDYLSFNKDITHYDLVVPPSVDSISFEHILEDETSGTIVKHGKVSKEGKSLSGFNLDVGQNYFKTVVQDSKEQVVIEYDYSVKRLSNERDYTLTGIDNNSEVLIFEDRAAIVRSAADNVSLQLSLKNDKDANFKYVITSDSTSVDNGVIEIQKNVTETPFKIKFWPEDSLEKYDDVLGINDNRSIPEEIEYKLIRASNDTSLSKVEIKNKYDETSLKIWNETNDVYSLEVMNDVSEISIHIITNHKDARIMTPGLDRIELDPGLNEISVKVNAPDGTEKIYKFEINRTPRKSAELYSLSIKINGEEKNTPITNVNKETNLELEYGSNYAVTIDGIANKNLGSKIKSGNVQNVPLSLGRNTFEVVVIAEDETTQQVYTININVKENSKSDLEDEILLNPDLKEHVQDPQNPIVDESILNEKDDSDPRVSIYRHRIDVLNNIKSFSIDDLLFEIPDHSKVVGGDEIDLAVGKNIFSFDIISQDNSSVSRYIFTINRAKNSVASVDNIHVISSPEGVLSGNLETGLTYRVPSTVFEYNVVAEVSDGTVVDEKTVGEGFVLEDEKIHIVRAISEDGTHQREYEIKIIREKSDDSQLSQFLISYGSIDEIDILTSFKNQQYTLKVDNEIDSIKIIPVTNHPKASFTINGTNESEFALGYGINNFAIEIRSETNKVVQYSFKVEREKSQNADLAELRIDGSLVDGWNSEFTNYEVDEVDESTKSLDITYVTADKNASVVIVGNELDHGENTIEIIVTAQDGITKKIYTLNVYRALSSSAQIDIEDISLNDSNFTIEPTDKINRFRIYVPFGTKTFHKEDVNINLEEGACIVFEDEFVELTVDNVTEYKFTVTSPNGKNSVEYIFEIIVMDSTLPMLDSAYINGKIIEQFDPTETELVLILDDIIEETDTDFEFTVKQPKGTNVSYFNPIIKVTNQQVIEQKVVLTKLSDGLTQTYTFKFRRTLTNNEKLKDINLSEGSLNPSFSENPNGPFEVTVGSQIEKIQIDPILENPNSSVQGDLDKVLLPGKNIVVITAESEDKSKTKDYHLVIYREIALTELKLGDLEVNVEDVEVTNGVLKYRIDEPISSELTEAYLKAVPNHPSVSIKGSANKNIVLDNNIIEFSMISHDGETELKVMLEYNRILSDDARLKNIESLNEQIILEPKFDKDIFIYKVDVGHDFMVFERDKHIRWETNHPNTRVYAEEKLDLDNKKTNIYEIKTESESGKTLTYTLNIKRGTYNWLEYLGIVEGEGHLENSFEPQVLNYEAMVYSGIERFSFEWEHQDGVTVINAHELVNISSDILPYEFNIEVAGDNGEVNIYKVMVNKGVSTRLINVATTEGRIEFSPDKYTYDVYVSTETERISLVDLETEDKQARIKGDFEDIELIDDETEVEVIVENAGYRSSYNFNFIKVQDLTKIESIRVNDGDKIWQGNADEFGNFEIIVNNETNIDNLNIDIILQDRMGSFEISDSIVNEDGSYSYLIDVEDKYGIKKQYSLKIKNDLSDNNFLEKLNVNGKKIPGFNRYATEYEIFLNADDELVIDAIAEHPSASVDIKIPETLTDNSIVEIVVTSEKGTPRVYRIFVEKEQKNTAKLNNLTLTEAMIKPTFNPEINTYFVTIPNELEYVTFNYDLNPGLEIEIESNGVINHNKVDNLSVGDNFVHFKIFSDDGSSNVYTINISREEPSNNFLIDLKVIDQEDSKSYSFNHDFSKDKLNYIVEVPYGKNNFSIEGEYESNLRVYGLEKISLQEYPYIHEIRVVDNKNITRTYSITFVQKASENPKLADLWTSEGPLSPVFESDKTSYSLDVEYEVKDIEILYRTLDDSQNVSGAGWKELKPGKNVFEITVESGDKSQIYTLFINRAYGTAVLDWLEVSEGDLNPEFNETQKIYKVEVDNSVEAFTINAGSKNEQINVLGTGHQQIDVGTNIFPIVVSNEFGLDNTYYIVVHRESAEEKDNPYAEDLSLAYLALENESLNEEFDANVFEYTADLNRGYYEDLKVIAIARNPEAVTEYVGNTDLGEGTHTIVVRVSYAGKHQDTKIHVNIRKRVLESDIHRIEDKVIRTVKEGQTVKSLKKEMLNPYELLEVYHDGNKLEEDEVVRTGSVIKLVDGDIEYDSRTIVVLGDVNGDGIVSIADLMKTQSYILGNKLTEIEKIAADVSGDGLVQINDFMMIQSHILELINIHVEVEDQ